MLADVVTQIARDTGAARRPVMFPAPRHQRHAVEREAHRGETVFEARRSVRIANTFQQAVLDQAVQAAGERRARGAAQVAELFEAVRALECIAQDQQSPTVADHAQCARDRAGGDDLGVGRHRANCRRSAAGWQRQVIRFDQRVAIVTGAGKGSAALMRWTWPRAARESWSTTPASINAPRSTR